MSNSRLSSWRSSHPVPPVAEVFRPDERGIAQALDIAREYPFAILGFGFHMRRLAVHGADKIANMPTLQIHSYFLFGVRLRGVAAWRF